MNPERYRGSDLRITVYPYTNEASDWTSLDVNIHNAEALTTNHSIYPCTDALCGGAFVARLFAGNDNITFFTDDPMALAEVLHALADSLVDEYWHKQNVFADQGVSA